MELLRAAVASGRAHVASPSGGVPEHATAWGWRQVEAGAGDVQRMEWRPQGERLGWVSGEDLYIVSDAAYAGLQHFGRDGSDGIAVSVQTLRKRLHQKGHLRTTDTARLELPRVGGHPTVSQTGSARGPRERNTRDTAADGPASVPGGCGAARGAERQEQARMDAGPGP
ncbi:MAG TPA: hypothetical protein VFA70_04540, partial [Dehalococcoidia bacterium]|nr:hypothetical protein [Dehalococcoidia bacterium]